MASLQFDTNYWEGKLGDVSKHSLDTKLHLILSLVIYLSVSVRQLLNFIFTSEIKAVKDRASRFLGYTPTHTDPNGSFPAAYIFSLWLERCKSPAQREQIIQMIAPVAQAAVLEDSDRVIKDMSLQIRIKNLTIAGIRELLDPSKLAAKYRALAPFFFDMLHVFATSPNDYRKFHIPKEEEEVEKEGTDNSTPDWNDPNEDYDEAGHSDAAPTSEWEGFAGFSRNPIFAEVGDKNGSSWAV
ncbi:hypothetical protein B0H16DRAFT_1900799, partial [Mycena metata]